MRLIVSRRTKWAIFVVLVLAPSILYLADYSLGTFMSQTKRASVFSSDVGWNATLQVSYPSYLISGEQVPVNVNLTVQLSGPSSGARFDDVVVEVRDPMRINTTTNLVETWRTLYSRTTQVGTNFTSLLRFQRAVFVTAVYSPYTGILDVLFPIARVTVNGAADFTVFGATDNAATVTHGTISLLDDQVVYQNQLSSIRSASSLLVYQVLAALVGSTVYFRTKALGGQPADAAYARSLEMFRLKSSLGELEELLHSHRIGEERYKGLKTKYEEALAKAESSS